jgi:signal transduction histidine kinase
MARASPIAMGSPGDGAGAPARLALAETLLSVDETAECAQRALDWLSENAGAHKAVCLLVEPDGAGLAVAASYRVSPAQMASLRTSLSDPSHPLALAMRGSGPIPLAEDAARNHRALRALGPGAVVAAPLPPSEKEGPRAGLLLASPATPALERELSWLCEPLGQKLSRLLRERSTREAELDGQRQRELLLNVVNAVPDPILLSDIEGRILVSNARADALFASRESESDGRRRAVALNNMLFSAALSRAALDDPGAGPRELLLVDPTEGSDLLFETLSAVVSHRREGTRVVSILRNVTDLRSATEQIEQNYRKLRLAEAAVRAERDRLDLIIDSVADPILVTDPGGKILLMNTPAERLFTNPEGADSEEANRTVRANDAHFSSFVSNLFFARESLRWRGEISLVDPRTGQPSPVEAISGKVLSERGEVTAVVTILHDRTEALERAALYEQLKQASEKLEQKVREATAELVRRNELLQRQHIELEQASELKSQFLANMSHEFRTPLNAILGYTSMLLQGVNGELQPPQKRNLSRVDSNAKHLLSIINDILDISRIEAGKMPLHLSEFGVQELIAELLAEVEPLIARTTLDVRAEVDPGVPLLHSDRQKLKQILLNFLTNAIKFTPRGTVEVRARVEGEEFAISVEDTGIGIAEQDHEKIFEDFRQADSSVTREYGGAGLGLSICRRLAGMLRGRIGLASRPDVGSTFTLWLPRQTRRR